MKPRIPGKELIPCPFCGALSYGRPEEVEDKDTKAKIIHIFCKSCNRDLTEAAKAYYNVLKRIEEIKKEGKKNEPQSDAELQPQV